MNKAIVCVRAARWTVVGSFLAACACSSSDGDTGGTAGAAGGSAHGDAASDVAASDGSAGGSADGGNEDAEQPDGSPGDGAGPDGTHSDGGVHDGSAPDADTPDADGSDADSDASVVDGSSDGSTDAGAHDGSDLDSGMADVSEAGEQDAHEPDAGPDAGEVDGGEPDGATGTLPACSASVTVHGPMATAANLSVYGSYDPGPLMLRDERAFVFHAGSDMWMVASNGSGMTSAVPAEIEGASRLSGWRGMTGLQGVTFERGGDVLATTFDGVGFSPAVVTPCGSGGFSCEARPAGDGHLWVYTGGNFYEQTASGFENRGGGPVTPQQWDVDSQGTLIVLGSGAFGS
ncbi:MAG: hypothetical protein ACOC1F_10370, partial [Myxococcota bacterium]